MGKSTINGQFSIAMLNYQRVGRENVVIFSEHWTKKRDINAHNSPRMREQHCITNRIEGVMASSKQLPGNEAPAAQAGLVGAGKLWETGGLGMTGCHWKMWPSNKNKPKK